MFVIGKLYEVIAATTPTGARWMTDEISPPGASGVSGIGVGSRGWSSVDRPASP